MRNTVNVNYMTSMVNRYTKTFSQKTSNESMSEKIADALSRKVSGENAGVEETSEVSTREVDQVRSKEDMTLDEYREYISDKIASFPLHPSQIGNDFAINISDVSLQKMKDDPEYEEWLLNDVKNAFGSAVPGWYQAIGGPSTYCVLNYENGEKGCWCHMWSKEYKGGSSDAKTMFDDESKDSIYTRRAERQKQLEKELKKKAQQKKDYEKRLEDEDLAKKLRNQEYLLDYYNQKYYQSSSSQGWQTMPGFKNPVSMAATPLPANVSAAYEENFAIVAGGGVLY